MIKFSTWTVLKIRLLVCLVSVPQRKKTVKAITIIKIQAITTINILYYLEINMKNEQGLIDSFSYVFCAYLLPGDCEDAFP